MRPFGGWGGGGQRRGERALDPATGVASALDPGTGVASAPETATGVATAVDVESTAVLARPVGPLEFESTQVLPRPVAPTAAVPPPAPPISHQTEVLDPGVAGALADPGAPTQVIQLGPPGAGPLAGAAAPTAGTTATPGAAALTVDRRTAAEMGLYAGAALILVPIVILVVRGWSDWDSPKRWTGVALASVALLGGGLWIRTPWGRPMSDARRRAVSAILTTAVAFALPAAGVALQAGRDTRGPSMVHAVLAAAAMLLVNLAARTPLSEVGLMVALLWALWVSIPSGPGTWLAMAVLGVVWAALALRLARGRRTAVAVGAGVALAACVGLAQVAVYAWPVRAGLAALALFGLVKFLRGGPNAWLALGVSSATALAGAVAGGLVSPALALVIAGATTMAVSGLAMRGTRQAA